MIVLHVINDILTWLIAVPILIVIIKFTRKLRISLLTTKYGKKIQRGEEHFWDILRTNDNEENEDKSTQ